MHNACPYLGCKEHGWDMADHGDKRAAHEGAKEASNEGDNGQDEGSVALCVHGPLQGRLGTQWFMYFTACVITLL